MTSTKSHELAHSSCPSIKTHAVGFKNKSFSGPVREKTRLESLGPGNGQIHLLSYIYTEGKKFSNIL